MKFSFNYISYKKSYELFSHSYFNKIWDPAAPIPSIKSRILSNLVLYFFKPLFYSNLLFLSKI